MFAGLVAFVGVLSAAFVGDPSLTDATTAVPPLDPPQALSLASNALNSSHAAWIGSRFWSLRSRRNCHRGQCWA